MEYLSESNLTTNLYPLFINEAAYYEKNIAMILTLETFINVNGVVVIQWVSFIIDTRHFLRNFLISSNSTRESKTLRLTIIFSPTKDDLEEKLAGQYLLFEWKPT